MKKISKREFLRLGALGITGAALMPWALNGCRGYQAKVPSWVWYSAKKDDKEIEKDLKFLKKAGFAGILFKGSEKKVEMAAALARQLGLEFHVWIISLMVNDPDIVKGHPDWYVVSREGKSILEHPPYVGYYKWLCPNKQGVKDYMTERVTRLASMQNVNGVHLDYIRFPDVILPVGLWKKYNLVQDKEYPQFDFCYCDDCRKKFREQAGVDPLDLTDPSSNKAWVEFRWDSITRLVNHLKEVTESYGKKLSAAVFPTPTIARKLVRQDWSNWNLDEIFPMMYHNFYEKDIDWLEMATREGEEALKGKFPLFSGLFVPAVTPDRMSAAVDYAMKGGAQGVCLFNFRGMSEKHWKNFLV